MITIKDFKVGDAAYEVIRNEGRQYGGRKIEPQIIERKVVSVGRIYVTVGDGAYERQYQEQTTESEYLLEKVSFGEHRLLFKTKESAADYLEKCSLARWIGQLSTSGAMKYTVEQLRMVKKILENQEEGCS